MPVNIVVSTGAGLSQESGIHTYRDKDGLWSKYDPMVVSHRQGWENNPEDLLAFMNTMRRDFLTQNYQPNAAHLALTKLQKEWKHGSVTIVTQNIDGLHRDAGADAFEIHGNNYEKICEICSFITPFDTDIVHCDACINCGARGRTRPKVCLFGEIPSHLDIVDERLYNCKIFAVIGSSLEVMPGNLFVHAAKDSGAHTFLITKDAPAVDLSPYDTQIYGSATVEVVKWVDDLLTDRG